MLVPRYRLPHTHRPKKDMKFGPGALATFLYYFSSTAVVFTLVSMRSLDIGLSSGLPQQFGLLGGVVGGLIGMYFNRTITLSVPVKSEKAFFKNLDTILSQMGYKQSAQDDTVRTYERTGLSKFLSGRVYVQVEKDEAAIASRSIQIQALKKLL